MSAAFWLLIGLAGGAAHFALLRYNAELYVSGSAVRAFGVQVMRMVMTTALLALAAWHGTMPLLFATLGFAGIRPCVLRRLASAP